MSNILTAELARGQELTGKKAADLIGMPKSTFWRKKKDPGAFQLRELQILFRYYKTDDQTILKIMKGGK